MNYSQRLFYAMLAAIIISNPLAFSKAIAATTNPGWNIKINNTGKAAIPAFKFDDPTAHGLFGVVMDITRTSASETALLDSSSVQLVTENGKSLPPLSILLIDVGPHITGELYGMKVHGKISVGKTDYSAFNLRDANFPTGDTNTSVSLISGGFSSKYRLEQLDMFDPGLDSLENSSSRRICT